MISTDSVFELLLNPSKGTDFSLLEWQKMLFVLREGKLVASLYHSAKRHDCYQSYPDYIKRHLYSAKVYAARQAMQIRYEATELRLLLEQINVSAIFLKGAGYTLRDSTNGHGRVCSDLDLLVEKKDIERAEAHLKQHRWKSEELSDYDEKYYRQWAHEIPPLIHINRSTVVDMHHNLYPPISGRSVKISSFISTKETTQSGCFVLDPISTVMHSIIHMFANEDSSSWARDLLDIILLIEEYQEPHFWQQLIKLAKQTKFEFEFISCLIALQRFSNFELPSHIHSYIENSNLTISQRWFIRHALLPAISIEHEYCLSLKQRIGKLLVYLRGHWIKMPKRVLLQHFVIKSWLALRDQVMGKHHFDPKLPKNPNW